MLLLMTKSLHANAFVLRNVIISTRTGRRFSEYGDNRRNRVQATRPLRDWDCTAIKTRADLGRREWLLLVKRKYAKIKFK